MTLEDQMVCEAIKAAVATSKRGYKEIGDKVGLSYNQLNNIANGRTKPDVEVVDKLRKELNKPPTWPYEDARSHLPRPGQRVSLAGTPMVEIPIVGSVAAGAGLYNVDVQRRKVAVPERLAHIGSIGYIVDGDSMMPFLRELDIAVIKEMKKRRSGYVYLFHVPGKGDMMKQLRYDRGDWYLVSLNKSYPPVLVPEGTQIVGMLVGYYRAHGTREVMDSDPEGLRFDEPLD